MVEGPGCKLKGERMKPRVVGQTVCGISGNAVAETLRRPRKKLKEDPDPGRDPKVSQEAGSGSPYYGLVGTVVTDVRTLGKELFIFLSPLESADESAIHPSCLRVHFLMAGYVRYNDVAAEDPDEWASRKRGDVSPRLQLNLERDTVSFFLCSVDLRPAQETIDRWERMITLDICWKQFDPQRTCQMLLDESQRERLVCDVIMDQEKMPGVGNIIKNEACFDAGINPLTKMKDLTPAHVTRLVRMTRDFSMIFYECRKFGKPLQKHYKIYRFSKCKQCSGKVVKCKPGEYERGTYYCPGCQDNNLARGGPNKNSILSWATGSGQQWTCEVCTLLNKPGSTICSACGTDRKKKLPQMSSSNAPSNSSTPASTSTENQKNSTVLPAKRRKLGVNENANKDNIIKEDNEELISVKCKGHSLPCVKKTVNKEGPNKGRLFYACSLSRYKTCNHFSWADLHHPKCQHGQVTVLREVYKLNQNNGRQFYACPKGKKERCEFFQWKE